MSDTETRERIVALEVKVEHLTKTIHGMDEKVTELHEMLLRAKGARWAILAMAGVGGFVAAKIAPLLSFIPFPK